MRSLKSLALLAFLLLSLSLSVFADTSKEVTHAKDEVKPSEATDDIEPQQRRRDGCRWGCCGSSAFGRCSACCPRPQAVDEDQTKSSDVAVEPQQRDEVKPSETTNNIEPQQRGRDGCRWGCCGSSAFGRCSACCPRPQAVEAKTNSKYDVAVEPQQRGRGGCRWGCCGSSAFGQCSACCPRPHADEAKPESKDDVAVEPQQMGFCRFGCCAWSFGRCNFCCRRPKQAEETVQTETVEPQQEGHSGSPTEETVQAKTVEANTAEHREEGESGPQAKETVETEAIEPQDVAEETVEPQQRWGGGCRYGCCNWRYGKCAYCCKSPHDEAKADDHEVVEPQQRRGCRYGCCGSYAFNRCSYCCPRKVASEEEKKKEEVNKP